MTLETVMPVRRKNIKRATKLVIENALLLVLKTHF